MEHHWSRRSEKAGHSDKSGTSHQRGPHTERTTERDQGASLLDTQETGHDPNEQAPRNEGEKEWKNVHTRSDADQRSPQVTKYGRGKLRAGKQQQQDGRARNGSEEERREYGTKLEQNGRKREAQCRTHLDGEHPKSCAN